MQTLTYIHLNLLVIDAFYLDKPSGSWRKVLYTGLNKLVKKRKHKYFLEICQKTC